MTFCKLEKDQKTFDYIQKYITWYVEQSGKDFLSLDSKIQLDEIKYHLMNNNFENKNQEILSWIKSNSEKFRIYLNTIKIVFAIWYCSGHKEIMDWTNFCSILDRVDEIKGVCLDEIMMDGNPASLDN